MNRLIIVVLICFNCLVAKSQNQVVKVEDLEFESIFGQNKKDSLNVYCLLGTGFFRAPRSDNADEIIKDWLAKNNDASVIIVSTLVDNKSNINYCWLMGKDGKTINEYLIYNGCFPGGTMMRPNTFKEMSRSEQKQFKNEKPNVIVKIDKESYEAFIEKIKLAETFARENKLGIWKKQ